MRILFHVIVVAVTVTNAAPVGAADRLLKSAPSKGGFRATQCAGRYPKHLQGVCTNERNAIYWCFTDALVKTDAGGRVIKQAPVASHHGDVCFRDGKVYVAVNLGAFNQPAGKADSWVYAYDSDSLEELARYRTPEVVHGAGGIAVHDGRFLVVGGLPAGIEENYLYEYDEKFVFRKRHVLASGATRLGIQTAGFAEGHWWFGCYGNPQILLKADESYRMVGKWEFDASLGILGIADGRLLVARGTCSPGKGCIGRVIPAVVDNAHGLRLIEPGRPNDD